jgi:hypothetical protein
MINAGRKKLRKSNVFNFTKDPKWDIYCLCTLIFYQNHTKNISSNRNNERWRKSRLKFEREPTKINLLFREVSKIWLKTWRDITSRYESLKQNNIIEILNLFCLKIYLKWQCLKWQGYLSTYFVIKKVYAFWGEALLIVACLNRNFQWSYIQNM